MVERINGSPVGQPRRIDSGNASQKAEDSKDVTTRRANQKSHV